MTLDRELKILFDSFCNYGTRQLTVELDGVKFKKLCRDCKLIDGKSLTITDVDIIFAKVKAKGTRRINFPQFEMALDMIAAKKGTSLEDMKRLVLGAGGPITNATKTDYVKFHDDRKLYTGMYKRRSGTGEDEASEHILRFDKMGINKSQRQHQTPFRA